LTTTELRKIKVSIKLAEELTAQDLKPSHDVMTSLIEMCDIKSSPADTEKSDTLSVNDINMLIDNFENLKSEDQNNLISFLQYLEAKDPDKFKNLH
jgi:N-acyl-D-aspartate/D-glutamate deacylase